ncbi:restriction endonuclease [Janthinobacterium sp. RA13]|uniref:restriction endonuclease n=1 Tax=Janthinobacterium sp. RA13 TaxID=1502762 RepID=UPI001269A30E|nr:restriction endonuclease [Janthinobacterium sp. RA13]
MALLPKRKFSVDFINRLPYLPMPTIFDTLHEELFNSKCTKEGEAFERIATLAMSIACPDADFSHDSKVRGEFSKSLYQIDVHQKKNGALTFGEAKDYTGRGKEGAKVGRPDLQKLGGALPDVEAERGVFYSATGYTREAMKYASAATNIVGVPIDLMHIRPSIESDMDGRIQKIVLTITSQTPVFSKATWTPIVTPAGDRVLKALLKEEQEHIAINLRVDFFYDSKGSIKASIEDLSRLICVNNDFGSDLAHASFHLPNHYIKVGEIFAEISGLEYSVPFSIKTEKLEIITNDEPKILLRAEDGSINKIITDKQLKEMKFDDSGMVIRPNPSILKKT